MACKSCILDAPELRPLRGNLAVALTIQTTKEA